MEFYGEQGSRGDKIRPFERQRGDGMEGSVLRCTMHAALGVRVTITHFAGRIIIIELGLRGSTHGQTCEKQKI